MPAPSNLLETVKQIIALHKSGKELAPRMRDTLAVIEASLSDLITKLKEIEEYVVLDSAALEEEESQAAMQLWRQLPAGVHNNAEKLRPFIESSPLLDSLFRKGFDVISLRKFTKAEVRLAKTIGDKFSEFSGCLRACRRARDGQTTGEKSILIRAEIDNGEFLRLLEREDIATLRRLLQKRPQGAWAPFEIEWFKNDERDKEIIAVFNINNIERFRFLQGEWLNAYVYHIIFDHLTRNRADFELYTDISYQPPADIMRVPGEFDVIGKVGNKLICVECKSGIILNERNTLSKVTEKIGALQDAVNSVSKEQVEFFFYLVFDPAQNNEGELLGLLRNSGIKPLKPDQVRPEVVRTFLLP